MGKKFFWNSVRVISCSESLYAFILMHGTKCLSTHTRCTLYGVRFMLLVGISGIMHNLCAPSLAALAAAACANAACLCRCNEALFVDEPLLPPPDDELLPPPPPPLLEPLEPPLPLFPLLLPPPLLPPPLRPLPLPLLLPFCMCWA